METEKYNWKKDQLKKTPMELLDGLYSMACICAVALLIMLDQGDKQKEAINVILNSKSWSMYALFITGVAVLGFALRSLITGIFKFIKFIAVLCREWKK